MYDLSVVRANPHRKPTRLKRHNCHFDAIDCTDLPYLIATAVVGNLYPHRHEMLALRSTCKTLCGAIDERLDSMLKALTEQEAKRCLSADLCRGLRRTAMRVRLEYPVAEMLESVIPRSRAQLFPLLFRCCCFCRKTRHRYDPNYPSNDRAWSKFGSEPSVFSHDRCFEEHIVVVLEHKLNKELSRDCNGSVHVAWCWSPESRSREARSLRAEARRMVKPFNRVARSLLPEAWEPSAKRRVAFLAVHPHPCVPDHLVLSHIVERSGQ